MKLDVIVQTAEPQPQETVDSYIYDVSVGSLWFNGTTWRKCTQLNPVVWKEVAVADHLHPTLGDVNFTGTVSAGGYAGVNQRVTIGTKKLTFKQGICILVEDV